MRASEVVIQLLDLIEEGRDPHVTAQCSGCCAHGHDIDLIEVDVKEGMDRYECTPYNSEPFESKVPDLILRCS